MHWIIGQIDRKKCGKVWHFVALCGEIRASPVKKQRIMAKTKFYLDTRGVKEGDPAPIKIVITHKNTAAQISTEVRVLPEQWDGMEVTGTKRAPTLNAYLHNRKANIDSSIYALILSGEIARLKSATDIKRRVLSDMGEEAPKEKRGPLFEECFIKYGESRSAEKTRGAYNHTLKKMREFDSGLSSRTFEDIDRSWLQRFDNELMKENGRNTANLHLRNIRAVFNEALDDEVTTAYPFRKIKIKPQATKDRSLTAEQMSYIFNYQCDDWRTEYIDIFKLMFMLIGINIGDLCLLDGIYAGRIEYDRLKTHKHYSIKVEPEAMEIIERYRGKKQLLSILDRYKSHSDYLHHLNNALKSIGQDCEPGKKKTGKATFPGLSTYYARYSWASIAADLDIPKETIAAALGHTTMDVTAIYIRTDMKKKIDAANRKVIDHVLGIKKAATE